ncbi:MAG TPA: hypothetical protein PLR60_11075 [Syntrophorhabdaceae bacterium]|nr:hypothetical protein [Syntrophorhabdaceae bacterium]
MYEKDSYKQLILNGAIVVAAGLFAIFRPDLLTFFFTYPIYIVKVYHILWLLVAVVLVKRMIPGASGKISSGKIFRRFYKEAAGISPARDEKLLALKRRTDSGALRSALYWLLLLADIGLWRMVGMLSDAWIYIIVLFFVFMDQFCVMVFCPFKWLMKNKCCSTCRIDNWGYLMAFSPMIYIYSFWTWSIVALSIIIVVQWEYLYHRYPERFFETHNDALSCRNCVSKCTGKRKLR